jgi:hypothetical protein
MVPDVTVPTVTVPTITVPSVTSPTPTPTPPPASVPSTPSVPSVSDVSGATSSIGAASDSGSGSAASGSGSSVSPRAGDARWTVTAKDPELRASRKKFKNVRERGEPYGTTLSFWLNRRGIVRLVIRREAPICDAIGIVTLRAEPGLNRVRFLGRWKRKPLPPGTYSVTGVVVRGGGVRSIGTVRLAIVGHSQDTDDARVRRSRCGAPAGTEAEERVTRLMAGDASFGSLDVQARDTIAKEVAAKTVSGSSDRSQLLGPAPRENASGDGGFVVNPLRGVPPGRFRFSSRSRPFPSPRPGFSLVQTNQRGQRPCSWTRGCRSPSLARWSSAPSRSLSCSSGLGEVSTGRLIKKQRGRLTRRENDDGGRSPV